MGLLSLTDLQQNDAATPDLFNTRFDAIIAVLNGNVDNLNLKDNAVTTPKIADQNVTTAKIADANVTTAKLADANVTFAKTSGIWWEELGRNTLTVAGSTLTVSFTARKYLKILAYLPNTGAVSTSLRYNNDSGTTYASRSSDNGAADGTAVSQTSYLISGSTAIPYLFTGEILNVAALEKIGTFTRVSAGTAGVANAPVRSEQIAKWTNTAAQISRIDILNTSGSNNYAIGAELVVLGHD